MNYLPQIWWKWQGDNETRINDLNGIGNETQREPDTGYVVRITLWKGRKFAEQCTTRKPLLTLRYIYMMFSPTRRYDLALFIANHSDVFSAGC